MQSFQVLWGPSNCFFVFSECQKTKKKQKKVVMLGTRVMRGIRFRTDEVLVLHLSSLYLILPDPPS